MTSTIAAIVLLLARQGQAKHSVIIVNKAITEIDGRKQMKLGPLWKSRMERMTLKNRILWLFAVATIIPFMCISYLSYNTITSILDTKLQSGIQTNLKQVRLSFENHIHNLNHVSQQLAYEGIIG